MSQVLAFWGKHHRKVYALLGALAVIVAVIVVVYVWRKSKEEEDQGSEDSKGG